MSPCSMFKIARQHIAVGTSLFALLVNLGAPAPAAAQAQPAAKVKNRVAHQARHRDHR